LADSTKAYEQAEMRLEIGFDTGQGRIKGGRTEISVGFVDI